VVARPVRLLFHLRHLRQIEELTLPLSPPRSSIVKVLLSVASLLADPNPHDPLMPDIAQKYLKNRKEHDKMAKDWTQRYATPVRKVPANAAPPKGSKDGAAQPVEVLVLDD